MVPIYFRPNKDKKDAGHAFSNLLSIFIAVNLIEAI
jgi:hypothetical protein